MNGDEKKNSDTHKKSIFIDDKYTSRHPLFYLPFQNELTISRIEYGGSYFKKREGRIIIFFFSNKFSSQKSDSRPSVKIVLPL